MNVRGKLISYDAPVVMGILNVTPDSFFDGSAYEQHETILARVDEMIGQGVDIIDVGGYSTRPGADDVPIEEEWRRVQLALKTISSTRSDVLVSVDTFRAEIARRSLEVGADIINDVSGGRADKDMFGLIADVGCPYILMHSRGTPQTMQTMTEYTDLLTDILHEITDRIHVLQERNVSQNIIIDLGFGFAKTLNQNYTLLKHLSYFKQLDLPLLVGVSMKSMAWRLLDIDRTEAGHATTALQTIALAGGADILRVHDVKHAKQCIEIHLQLKNS